ncbi:cyclase family protein [Xenorhabdus siamensis]|uniref:cyclase family protein n=1 Tax=Xenorhabdus siamensis TaxID=3136254 RepID=UPI0030F46100
MSGKDHADNTVDTIPLHNFIAPAVVVDASQQVARYSDWLLTVEFLQAWEEQYGRIPAQTWLLLALV